MSVAEVTIEECPRCGGSVLPKNEDGDFDCTMCGHVIYGAGLGEGDSETPEVVEKVPRKQKRGRLELQKAEIITSLKTVGVAQTEKDFNIGHTALYVLRRRWGISDADWKAIQQIGQGEKRKSGDYPTESEVKARAQKPKPTNEGRWKPGQTGNLEGRPKGKTKYEMIEKELIFLRGYREAIQDIARIGIIKAEDK